jgi:hypothetical protein
MQRMYDLANWTLNGDALSEEDRKKYEWDFENGNWAGYKPPVGWSEVSGVAWRGVLSCFVSSHLTDHPSTYECGSLTTYRGARRNPTSWSFTTGTENAGTRT